MLTHEVTALHQSNFYTLPVKKAEPKSMCKHPFISSWRYKNNYNATLTVGWLEKSTDESITWLCMILLILGFMNWAVVQSGLNRFNDIYPAHFLFTYYNSIHSVYLGKSTTIIVIMLYTATLPSFLINLLSLCSSSYDDILSHLHSI